MKNIDEVILYSDAVGKSPCDAYLNQSEEIFVRQISILNIELINSFSEAEDIVFYLTNHDGKIREMSAFKINGLIKNSDFTPFFQTQNVLNGILKAISDINPNVCRLIIEILDKFENKDYFKSAIVQELKNLLDKVKIKPRGKSHENNKIIFKIFWHLEAVSSLINHFNSRDLEEILIKTYTFEDYTIREKTAKILSGLQDKSVILLDICEKLKNDENFYVRNSGSAGFYLAL